MKKILALFLLFTLLSGTILPGTSRGVKVDGTTEIEKKSAVAMSFTYGLEVDVGENVDFSVESSKPVDVYIISEKYLMENDLINSTFSKAVFSRENVTEVDATWKRPDDRSYGLTIVNNKSEKVEVSYSYEFEITLGELRDDYGNWFIAAVATLVVVLGAIVSLSVWLFKMIRKEKVA